MSRSEFRPDDSHLDLSRLLEQHLVAGFPSDLALDLILNELVVRAAEATRASAAALALARGDEMVCRAATGHLAPDLGVPLNPRDGLSGACLQTRQPQLSVDTEFDPRVDPAISRRLGIRSILIVPVFDSNDKKAQFTGVLEVFSTSPAAFSNSDQKLLEGFAEECTRVRHAAIELSQRKPAATLIPREFVPPELTPPDFIAAGPLPASRPPYEAWTLVLGSLVILATIAVSFLIGSRIGWLRPPPTASSSQITQPIQAETSKPQAPASSTATAAAHRANPSSSEKASAKASKQTSPTPAAAPAADELVVYEKGKVIFRMKPAPTKPDQAKPDLAKHPQQKPDSTKQASDSIVEASSTTRIAPAKIATTKIAPLQGVWLSPEKAETRLLSRTEPQYPPEALAAHRSGNVVLEVHVAEDGSVSNIRTLSGDPLLAAAAAKAVSNWRYQPYRLHDHPAQFQTDVTLSFSLPN
jgi:protein TonB